MTTASLSVLSLKTGKWWERKFLLPILRKLLEVKKGRIWCSPYWRNGDSAKRRVGETESRRNGESAKRRIFDFVYRVWGKLLTPHIGSRGVHFRIFSYNSSCCWYGELSTPRNGELPTLRIKNGGSHIWWPWRDNSAKINLWCIVLYKRVSVKVWKK